MVTWEQMLQEIQLQVIILLLVIVSDSIYESSGLQHYDLSKFLIRQVIQHQMLEKLAKISTFMLCSFLPPPPQSKQSTATPTHYFRIFT